MSRSLTADSVSARGSSSALTDALRTGAVDVDPLPSRRTPPPSDIRHRAFHDQQFLNRFQVLWVLLVAGSVVLWAALYLQVPQAAGYVGAVLVIAITMLAFWRWLLGQLLTRDEGKAEMRAVSEAIRSGAEGYLATQYGAIFKWAAGVAFLLFFIFFLRNEAEGSGRLVTSMEHAVMTLLAFAVGALFSGVSGYVGMWLSVRINARVAAAASVLNYQDSLLVALKGGLVSGILVVSLCVLGLAILFSCWHLYLGPEARVSARVPQLLVGYGFGASLVALFAQLGGGIYTKAADVGADMVGKVEQSIPEDDPRNPAVIADLVGDNVGDCAGRGADLFESITGEILGAMIIGSQLAQEAGLQDPMSFMFFPVLVHVFDVLISSIGVCVIRPRKVDPLPPRIPTDIEASKPAVVDHTAGMEDPLKTIERGYVISLGLALMVLAGLSMTMLDSDKAPGVWKGFYGCAITGIVTSYLFVEFTKYYTDYNYGPVRRIAEASRTGHGTNVIAGMAVGFESGALPVLTVGTAMIISFWLGQTSGLTNSAGQPIGGLFGNAVATMGMLSTAVYVLAMDTFGPITDNAGGIVEMSNQSESARTITDRLDAVGNVTKATTKGYSIGAAALASFLLLRAFLDVVEELTHKEARLINLAIPEVFISGLLGGMLIFLFSGMAMTAVGKAAGEVVREVRMQFDQRPGIMDGSEKPDYERCVAIVTRASLSEMVRPALLAVFFPPSCGIIFRAIGSYTGRPLLGVECAASMLLFATAAGVLTALFLNNAGGAWDNAKKYIESGYAGGKGSMAHAAAVTGDTVGDPCKDTAGPSIHVLIKLLSTITLVTCPLFVS
eukprot:TRINITY_DN509_c0_g1_i9.p1 TRINITY_DN509_c0_g1~~TRINITY_DN509_c0_g1_i9.p1  ORF type:complete len:877 (+),score=314.68 TRINITY_DN509_c0_g1_i9:119-2632(+)